MVNRNFRILPTCNWFVCVEWVTSKIAQHCIEQCRWFERWTMTTTTTMAEALWQWSIAIARFYANMQSDTMLHSMHVCWLLICKYDSHRARDTQIYTKHIHAHNDAPYDICSNSLLYPSLSCCSLRVFWVHWHGVWRLNGLKCTYKMH